MEVERCRAGGQGVAGKRKPQPIEIFELTMDDADHLVALVEGFTNQRARRMRTELRSKFGSAMSVRERDRAALDCLESDDLFVIFKPRSRLCRGDFVDARPLLRQALVAACAAFETYLADKAMSRVSRLMAAESTLTPRLRELPLTMADWMAIDRYEKKRWGLKRYVVEPAIREMASTSPNKVGELLSMLGIEKWSRRVDAQRGVARGRTVRRLEEITKRRNRIAHQADIVGRGRAQLTVGEVHDDINELRSVVEAIEAIL